MKALLVKTSSMGDVIHTFPAITDLARYRPDVTLDWCVEASFADLAGLHPNVATVYPVALRAWRGTLLSGATRDAIGKLRTALRSARYDRVLDAQGLMKSALLARLPGAPIAGYDFASVREPLATAFYRQRFAVERNLHAVERTRRLFALAFGYPLEGPPKPGLVSTSSEVRSGRALLLHGTSWEAKKWPVANWIEVATGLVDRALVPVTIWADESERRVALAIAAAEPRTVVLPKSSLAVLAAEIAQADLVVGVDTGLMHLADACRRPTVALFLATSPDLTGPLGPNALILPEDAAALRRPRRRDRQTTGAGAAVAPVDVLEAADRLLLRATGP